MKQNIFVLAVIDLKLIRHCVDYVVNFFYPVSPQLESEIAPLLAARSDIVDLQSIQYESDQEDQDEVKKAFVKLKAKQTFGTGATTIIGAVLKKQKCYERTACTLGTYLKDFAGKDVTFM